MEINKNNWFARYYYWICDDYPKDICTFFWASVAFILLFPFIIPGRLLSNRFEDGGDYMSKSIVFWIILLILMVVGNSFISNFGYEFVGFWGIFGLGILFGALVIGIIAALLIGIIWIFVIIYKSRKSSNYKVVKQNTTSLIGAIRGKYCTKITWKD